jgi:chemotaxis family two-component system response regulator Rcp1
MTVIAKGYAPVQCLSVEDSAGNVRLTLDAFRNANTSVRLHVATDAIEAMAFPPHERKHRDAPRPDLILLDLNLPSVDGREVLALFKEDAVVKTIRTFVLTTSEADADIVASYKLHATCYLTKPWRSTNSRSW